MELLTNSNSTPFKPFLSIPESSNQNLNSFLSLFFQRLPGTNIDPNLKDATAAVNATIREENEITVSLVVINFILMYWLRRQLKLRLKNCILVNRFLRPRSHL